MANEIAVAGPGGCGNCGAGEGAPHADVCVRVARADYEAAFGKKPFHGWSTSILRDKIAASPHPEVKPSTVETIMVEAIGGGPGQSSGGSHSPSPAGATVMLLCNHVFLPEDPTREDWEKAPTIKYDGRIGDRRARVVCHPTLAAFLQKREQGEIL